ncbi:hypothetical protein [Scytonema sp. UIC 10036]
MQKQTIERLEQAVSASIARRQRAQAVLNPNSSDRTRAHCPRKSLRGR